MNKKWYGVIILVIFVAIFFYIQSTFTIKTVERSDTLDFVSLQEGYSIEIFADDLGPQTISRPGPNKGVRMLEYKNGIIYATLPGRGEVVKLYDQDNDWEIEKREVLIEDLNNPHGIAFHNDYVYIAEEDTVIRFKEETPEQKEKLVELPTGGHWTRTIKIINDELYISIGSSCNACEEEHLWRAAIVKCNLDGSNCDIFAKGLRNSVGFIEHDNQIWATDNGRDLIGNDIPPEEINIIEEGHDYGWPLCYGNKIHDTDYDNNVYVRNPCEDTTPPIVEMQAHSAPLGLTFYEETILVAFHGSWNRQPPTGYKIVQINPDTKEITDFASGWLDNGDVHGRPVDLLIVRDSILVSDDVAGVIYRIYKE